jgi:hypothetical protein
MLCPTEFGSFVLRKFVALKGSSDILFRRLCRLCPTKDQPRTTPLRPSEKVQRCRLGSDRAIPGAVKAFYLVVLVAAVAGCGAIPNRYAPERLSVANQPKDAGTVILSAGAAEHCSQAATFLRVKEAGASYHGVSDVAMLGVDASVAKSDFDGHHGLLHVFTVPAGSYYLAPWLARPSANPIQVPKAEFSVASGEVVYLGEYFLTTACSLSNAAAFRDQAERDLALLRQKNPQFVGVPITKRIAAFTGYAVKRDR